MIIFFNKTTGEIVGTIEGRVHDEHQDMWMGNKNEIDRMVVQWRAKVPHPQNDDDFEPMTNQKELFITLDKRPTDIKFYKVDISSMNVIKI